MSAMLDDGMERTLPEKILRLVGIHQQEFPGEPIDDEWLGTAYTELSGDFGEIEYSEFAHMAHQAWKEARQ